MKKNPVIIFLLSLTTCMPVLAQETDIFTDSRDGKVYRTVKIGDQIWMAENLAYLPAIDMVKDLSWDRSRYWVYGYYGGNVQEAKKTTHFIQYGVLYNWPAAMNDACPDGWRIPGEPDWQKLELLMGMDRNQLQLRDWRETGAVGRKLKSTSGWDKNSGTDEADFGALPGGLLGYDVFETRDFCGYFWVGTATHRDNAWVRSMLFDRDGIQRIEERKWFGCSVRCIKEH